MIRFRVLYVAYQARSASPSGPTFCPSSSQVWPNSGQIWLIPGQFGSSLSMSGQVWCQNWSISGKFGRLRANFDRSLVELGPPIRPNSSHGWSILSRSHRTRTKFESVSAEFDTSFRPKHLLASADPASHTFARFRPSLARFGITSACISRTCTIRVPKAS